MPELRYNHPGTTSKIKHGGLQTNSLTGAARLSEKDFREAAVEDIGLLETYYFHLRSRNLSPKTIKDYTERLGYLIRFAKTRHKGLLDLTTAEISHFLVDMVDRLAPITINGRRKDWNLFYDFVEKQGLGNHGWKNPVAKIPKMKEPKRVKRLITPDEYSRMIRVYKPTFFQNLRNRCILLVAWDTMVRRQELLTIRLCDVELRPHKLLRVLGKGNKERLLTFSNKTALQLSRYIHEYRGDYPGELFFCTKYGTQIDERHGHRIFVNAGRKCGLPMIAGPHLVRRSSATHFWRKTGNIYLISQILGHANVAITETYVQANAADLVNMYDTMAPADDLRI